MDLGNLSKARYLASLFIVVVVKIQYVSAANILVWQAIGSHSTRLSMWPLMEALSERGHNVSFLSGFENIEKKLDNAKIHYILPKKWVEAQEPWESEHQSFFEQRKNPLNHPKFFFEVLDSGIHSCKVLYSDPEFLEFVKADTTKFDLIIIDNVWNDCAYGLVHYWKTKSITFGTSVPFPFQVEGSGLPDESSSIVDIMFDFSSSKNKPMTFIQRFLNAFGPIINHLYRKWFYMPQLEEITREALGLKKGELPSFMDIEKNVSVNLLTTHYTFGKARSFPPNFIPVGGTVVGKNKKPLPKDMEQFIENGKDGFIYISFGTVTEFANFDEDVQQEFIAGLEKFPKIQFVWKSTEPIKFALPKNVFVAKWAPQQTLLAHPKIKAFISHGGMGSSVEAVHSAVPIVAIPVLADQNMNAALIEERGAGVQLEVLTLKRDELVWAIKEILENPKYRQGMQKLSKMFKDRPRPPLEEAVWWVEYTLRHDNVHEFLAPPSLHQPWWKKRQIDVWLTASVLALIIITAPIYLALLILRKVIRLATGGKQVVQRKKKMN